MKGKNKANKKFKSTVILFLLITCFFSIFSVKIAVALNGADVAIYTDLSTGYSGAWHDGFTAIKQMLKWMGVTYEEIDYSDLNYSTQDFSGLYKLIFIPGGMAYYYNYWICGYGKYRIRDFVSNGGGYFGICAGSFFAVDRALWDDQEGGGNSILYDDDDGYTDSCGGTSGYSLDLYPGIGTGPMNDIASFYDPHEGWAMTTINFQESTVLSNFKGSTGTKSFPFSEDILYYGGPYFTIDENDPLYGLISNYEVLATYDYNDEPAIVAFQYGSGKVVLCGPHPEIEEDSWRDKENLLDYPLSPRKSEMDDNGSDWELVSHIIAWLMDVTNPLTYVLTPPPNTTVVRGDLLGPIRSAVTNNTASYYQFHVNSYLIKPDGTILKFRKILTGLDSGKTRIHKVFQRIPQSSEFGTFTWRVKLTDTAGNIIDNDFFYFRVVNRLSRVESAEQNRQLMQLKNSPGSTDQIEKNGDWEIIINP